MLVTIEVVIGWLVSASGDVVFCELSASWWDYPGQVLRSFTVGADPTHLYRDLHSTAEAAFDAVTGVIRHGTTMQAIVDAASRDLAGERRRVLTHFEHHLSWPVVGACALGIYRDVCATRRD